MSRRWGTSARLRHAASHRPPALSLRSRGHERGHEPGDRRAIDRSELSITAGTPCNWNPTSRRSAPSMFSQCSSGDWCPQVRKKSLSGSAIPGLAEMAEMGPDMKPRTSATTDSASAWREALVQSSILSTLRQRLVAKSLSEPIKSSWRSGVMRRPRGSELKPARPTSGPIRRGLASGWESRDLRHGRPSIGPALTGPSEL